MDILPQHEIILITISVVLIDVCILLLCVKPNKNALTVCQLSYTRIFKNTQCMLIISKYSQSSFMYPYTICRKCVQITKAILL